MYSTLRTQEFRTDIRITALQQHLTGQVIRTGEIESDAAAGCLGLIPIHASELARSKISLKTMNTGRVFQATSDDVPVASWTTEGIAPADNVKPDRCGICVAVVAIAPRSSCRIGQAEIAGGNWDRASAAP